jgi:hypothetical protein
MGMDTIKVRNERERENKLYTWNKVVRKETTRNVTPFEKIKTSEEYLYLTVQWRKLHEEKLYK